MATQSQIQANRLNAQKSTGPKTPQGKTTASQNALKHGLYANCDVIVTESQEEYDFHRDSLIQELAPQTPMEAILADRIISLSWRLKRADIIQNQTFDAIHERNESNPFPDLAKTLIRKALNRPNPAQPTPHDRPAPQHDLTLGRIALKDFANERVLDRLLMYERRIENSLHKTILELQRLTLIREMTPTNNPEPTPQQALSVSAGVSTNQNTPPTPVRATPCTRPSTTVEPPLQTQPFPAKQTQSQKPKNHHNPCNNQYLQQNNTPDRPGKQTQSNPIPQYEIERSPDLSGMHIGIQALSLASLPKWHKNINPPRTEKTTHQHLTPASKRSYIANTKSRPLLARLLHINNQGTKGFYVQENEKSFVSHCLQGENMNKERMC